MKIKKFILSLICLLALISSINSLANSVEHEIHSNAEYSKAVTLENGNVLVISSEAGTPQITHIAELDKDGRILYSNSKITRGISSDAQLVQQKNGGLFFLSHHNKQGLSTSDPSEYLVSFKEKGTNLNTFLRKSRQLFQKSSLVALKNGKILLAGILPQPTFGAKTIAEVNLFNPQTNTFKDGETLTSAYSKYINCFEQKENEVYCMYVSYEDNFISKLKLKHYTVNGDSLTSRKEFIIKNFFTEFNFLKAVTYNEAEASIIFQVGNENDGIKDLYYYQLSLDPAADTVSVKRYEYLSYGCKYVSDPEYYNADIAVLSANRIYIVCETDSGKFKGFHINPSEVKFEEFNFNNFDAKEMTYPSFAKFGQSLGLIYTSTNDNNVKKIAHQIMNFPDCEDYTKNTLLPIRRVKTINLGERYHFLSNPYPANRIKEKISIRFNNFTDLIIKQEPSMEEIKPNIDYYDIDTLEITPSNKKGNYYLEFTSTRMDDLDGLIFGKTCKVNLYTPECLDRCDSCTEKGTDEHHQCLGCKVGGNYYYEHDPQAVYGEYGLPHNCPDCNISCNTCYGPFNDAIPTTNCKLCDYDNNYFHYEFNEKTCISNETKKYWESIFGVAIYLDKSAGPEKKNLWRWKHCHSNCAECFEKGDDDNNKCTMCKPGFYFYSNQTEENGGIPGSCNNICPNNGFYVTTKEKEREKCCPCLDHCKECTNSTHCDKCYPPFFKTNEGTLCNETCGYCLAEDRNLWECVNCKTRFGTPKYLLNKTCVNEIPFIDFLNRYHHIIDDTCNLLIGCKEGCHKCDPWYSDDCTECNSSYYKEDLKGDIPEPNTFKCFDEDTCKGIKKYIHDRSLRIGGVPVQNFEGKGNLCLNCRRQNDSYRLPEDRFYCSDKIPRTYVDIPEYNKLSYCYFRCAECEDYGNGVVMNCTKCRDYPTYLPDFEIYNISIQGGNTISTRNYSVYNCYRKPPKCGIFPYYHDYDYGEKIGKEDNCGEECDFCMYNMTCPEHLPFYVFSTRECIEYCAAYEIFSNSCIINDRSGINTLFDNLFDLKDPYDLLNNSATLNEILSSKFFAIFDLSGIKADIHKYLGSGQVYNLQESKIIVQNNITIEVSSIELELKKLNKLYLGESINTQAAIIDLAQCENLLKKKYNLPSEESLIIIKGEFPFEVPEKYIKNQIAYQLFSTSIGAFLPLIYCKEAGISTNIWKLFESNYMPPAFAYRLGTAAEQNYNVFDPTSNFFNDICTPFTNENGNDVPLDERRLDYFTAENNLCEDGCQFLGYNESIKWFSCKCEIKSKSSDISQYEIKPMAVPEDFYKRGSGYSNIKIFKCSSQVFSAKGQKGNYGSYILMGCFAGLVGMMVFYFLKGKKQAFEKLDELNELKEKKEKKIIDKEVAKNKENYGPLKKPVEIKDCKEDRILREDELNFGNFNDVNGKDLRSPSKMYWSFLKFKQIILYACFTSDRNIRALKISLLILFVSFYMAFTALFFNDDIMRAIYTYKGNTDAAVHVPNIVLSSLCCIIMSFIVRLVTLSERDINKIILEKNPGDKYDKIKLTKRSLNIRAIIFFIISIGIIGLCWYYVSAFCAVFKNSQKNYLINTLISFIVCNLWPLVTSGITVGLRRLSLKKESPCLYKFSQVVSLF